MVYDLLTAKEVFSTIGSVALAILILLAMITIHEFGHYIAGKIFHFEITEFSVGFGPAIFKRKSKKTGELFAVRVIPLGGYCAFAGEDGLEEEEEKAEGKENAAPSEENADANAALSPSEGTEETPAPPPSLPSGETVPPSQEEAAPSEESKETPAADRSGWFTNRPCWQRIIVLIAGACMNYLLALLLILIGFVAYGQTMVAVYEAEEETDQYVGHSLHDLDILLQIEGKNLYLTSDIAHALNGRKEGDRVTVLVSRVQTGEDGQPLLDGEGKKVRAEEEIDVMLRADVAVRNSADFTSVWNALGVKYYSAEEGQEEGYALANAIYRFGFGEALGRGFVYSFKIAGSIFKILGELLTGKLGISAFGGPVTTIRMTSQIASRGFRYFLEISGYIGVNLAVFNLLPIPALDGSKVVFTAIEWVRGKPLPRKIEAIIHAVGFILLLGFAVLVDILQFV